MEKKFQKFQKFSKSEYVTLDVNGDGNSENLLRIYSVHEDPKNCKIYEKIQSSRSSGVYYLADLEFKNIITLGGGGSPKAFQYPKSGDFFNYKKELYFVTMDYKVFSKENNKFYSELRLSKVPHPQDFMGASEKCFYHFVWP